MTMPKTVSCFVVCSCVRSHLDVCMSAEFTMRARDSCTPQDANSHPRIPPDVNSVPFQMPVLCFLDLKSIHNMLIPGGSTVLIVFMQASVKNRRELSGTLLELVRGGFCFCFSLTRARVCGGQQKKQNKYTEHERVQFLGTTEHERGPTRTPHGKNTH